MSFVVIVPAWKEDVHWLSLINHPFYQGHFVLNAADHSYCDGFQHESTLSSSSTGSLYRPAPFDTALFFLQNDQGKTTDLFFFFFILYLTLFMDVIQFSVLYLCAVMDAFSYGIHQIYLIVTVLLLQC